MEDEETDSPSNWKCEWEWDIPSPSREFIAPSHPPPPSTIPSTPPPPYFAIAPSAPTPPPPPPTAASPPLLSTVDREESNARVGVVSGETSKLACKPFVGMEFDSITMSDEFWKAYGFETGFSVRTQNTNIRKNDGTITSKMYVCSKEGKKGEDKRRITSKRHAETRCGCGVFMTTSLSKKTGKYYVKKFVEEHNHELEGKDTIHQLRSHHNISDIQAATIKTALRAGLGPAKTHRFMAVEAGGLENLSFSKENMKTFLRNVCEKNMLLGEASTLLEYFQEQSQKNSAFFHTYQLDFAQKITNVFWADAKMLADYEAFGDIISFDTTFGTNNHSRPLGIFSGFNNHRQIVVFGAALLYDETIPSFAWLLTLFIQCHGGKLPGIVFTDQDAAMKAALKAVLPTVRHALCSWHISKNIMDKMGCVLRGNMKEFISDFFHCVYGILDPDELALYWTNMVGRYGVKENPWMQKLYKKLNKFCIAYFKDVFTAGARSTQMSESINRNLKKDLGRGLTMRNFFTGYDLFLMDVRRKESISDCYARQTSLHLANEYSSILKQAAATYTPKIFNLFTRQFNLECVVRLDKHEVVDMPQVIIATVGAKSYTINFDSSSLTISCTCARFEMWGYVCAHVLSVFRLFNIEKIPDKYIKKRWTRKARSGYELVENSYNGLTYAQKIDVLHSECRKVVNRIGGSEELFESVRRIIISAHLVIDEHISVKEKVEENHSQQPVAPIKVNGPAVMGLKKKKVQKHNVGKGRIIAWNEFQKNPKRARAIQQRKLKSQSLANVDLSLSHALEGETNVEDNLTRLTL